MHVKQNYARVRRVLATSGLTAVFTLAGRPALAAPAVGADASAVLVPRPVSATAPTSLFGRSGKLRFKLFSSSALFGIPVLERLFSDPSAAKPGVYPASEDILGRPFSFISLIPFTAKSGGRLGDYRIGFWPSERRRGRTTAYENPEGFIEVTPETQDLYISEHFRLRDFLTHDQRDVWPKYLVLREDLVDKLELVIDDLGAHGVRVDRMVVMSGFRTPQYNAKGVGRGRARDSRHQFGDAADVFVDNDGNGRMDDLNRDRRVDTRDARIIMQAIERVERAHPELVGGAALYRATKAHGPFAHVDVRGARARWGRS
ncbi:MAG TPA: D-Ala-D-Ala carboxypeptidase family metallohydrolase [Gemmatimonadaceae bacterium]|nr:D-Ala-D-Ala carboxypeptidase family metallohydrolase [Gemmatimonadaceae bacterium]